MTWQEALELVVEQTRHEPYRRLCSDDHPRHEEWRARMIARATGEAPKPAEYPPVATQIGNALAAAGRAIGAAATGGAVLVPFEVYQQRLSICRGCEQFYPETGRCKLCGCYTYLKLRAPREHCPDDPPRWPEWEAPKSDDDHA